MKLSYVRLNTSSGAIGTSRGITFAGGSGPLSPSRARSRASTYTALSRYRIRVSDEGDTDEDGEEEDGEDAGVSNENSVFCPCVSSGHPLRSTARTHSRTM